MPHAPTWDTAAPQMLGAADNGRTITLKVGEVSMLRLPANPGTGYVWQTVSGADPRVLIVMDKGYDRPVSDAPGTAGQAWWKLRATGEGTTSLAMRYVRPWETDAKAEEFAVNVTVVSTR